MREVIGASALVTTPYLAKCTGSNRTVVFHPADDELRMTVSEGNAEVHLGNELVLFFAGLSGEMQQLLPTVLMQEMHQSGIAGDRFFLRMTVDTELVNFKIEPEAKGSATCWIAKSCYICIKAALFAERSQIASLAFFNGRAPMTGTPEPYLLGAILEGLAQGKAGLEIRSEMDELRCHRRSGEWRQNNGGTLAATHSLVVTVLLFGHDGGPVDGTLMSDDVASRLVRCASSASTALAMQIQKMERERVRRERIAAIRELHSGEIGEMVAAMMAKGRPQFVHKAKATLDETRFHGESDAAVVKRILNDMCDRTCL